MYQPNALNFSNLILDPVNDGTSRKRVWLRQPGGADTFIGDISETVGAGWLAEFYVNNDASGEKLVGVPGFRDERSAAEFLLHYQPPAPSELAFAHLKPCDEWVHGTIAFRGETVEDAAEAIKAVTEAMENGEHVHCFITGTQDVTLTVKNN